jgi:prefoldin subunit 5
MDQRFVGAKSPPEKESLEKQAQILESQLEMIRKRIGELPVIEKQE